VIFDMAFNFGSIKMKRIVLVSTAFALAMAAESASAAANGPTAGSFGVNVGFTQPTAAGSVAAVSNTSPRDFMINGKYFISKDMAVLAGVGLVIVDSGQAINSKSTNIGFQGGIRKYLKTDELAPFVGGKLQYLSTRVGAGGGLNGAQDVTDFALMAEGGAEYFLSKQFSLEGSIGFGYSSSESQPASGGASTKATAFGSTMFSVSANFYF
jgi:hypothetical protein